MSGQAVEKAGHLACVSTRFNSDQHLVDGSVQQGVCRGSIHALYIILLPIRAVVSGIWGLFQKRAPLCSRVCVCVRA